LVKLIISKLILNLKKPEKLTVIGEEYEDRKGGNKVTAVTNHQF
jgi:hypothetical protein